jgi:hypothetical protein
MDRPETLEAALDALRGLYGDGWARDPDESLRFSIDLDAVLDGIEGAHLLGHPEIDGTEVTIRMWVDQPVPDLVSADALAYQVFGRISEEIFMAERTFEPGGLRYPFVTGSRRRGLTGTLTLTGPHAAEFADRFRKRVTGGARFHA